MRLIRCRKCGATIATDETFVERMFDAIRECENLARKDKKNKGTYLQEASAIKSIMKAYLHTTAQMDEHTRSITIELGDLVHYVVVEKGFMTYEEIDSIRLKSREKAQARNKEDQKRINELYGNFENISFNRTKSDPTSKAALKEMRKNHEA